jgi:para-aminobenzoate synthetase component 1
MLKRANRFNIFCLMDNAGYDTIHSNFNCLLAMGAKRSVTLDAENAFTTLREFYEQKKSWLFGHLGYELKNGIEKLNSRHPDTSGFGSGYFFEPAVLLQLFEKEVMIDCDVLNAEELFLEIENEIIDEPPVTENQLVEIHTAISKQEYLQAVLSLKKHIQRGECYEINFCQYFSAKNVKLNPLKVYNDLLAVSPNPFAALYKLNDEYCICASPERYLKKTGQVLLSQPIKGTTHRDLDDAIEDKERRQHLLNSAKDRSENVMVVDLVRNDLSKVCKEGSVKVEELFGIYSFPQVHQMISSVTGELEENIHWTDAIKATFPMGSMTGAPKKRVMELIDQYESQARGLFSGSIGYVTPTGDFDFNVVIRSIFLNALEHRLSFAAGGGITFYSNAEEEYEESLLKAAAIRKVLQG